MADERREQPDRRAAHRGGRRYLDRPLACPFCGSLQSAVMPYHPTPQEQQSGGFWRRRECGACKKLFPTQEIVRAS